MAMKGVSIRVIPHNDQAYETPGDWWFDDEGILQIRVSEMGSWRYEQLVAFHEYAEALMCYSDNISEAEVTAFDKEFEAMREKFPTIVGEREPGNAGTAPYRKQHQFASKLEYQLSEKLHVVWKEYDVEVNSLKKDTDGN